MKPLHIKTACIKSEALGRLTNKHVFLKMECQQPTGSFKIRGIGLLCQSLFQQGCQSFISSSGGNAGIAAAYAGQQLNINTTIFVPKSTHPIFLDHLKSKQAQVIITGNNWNEADQAAQNYLQQNGGSYIPPYDHPLIWQGHASMMTEIKNQIIKPDAVVIAVGGGGLLMGVLTGLKKATWQDIPIFAVETQGAACFAKSIQANKKITLQSINTIATSLGAKSVCDELLVEASHLNITPIVVSDKQAIDACQFFFEQHNILVEPACGATLSAMHHEYLKPFRSILVIVCGGVGISEALLKQYQQTLTNNEKVN